MSDPYAQPSGQPDPYGSQQPQYDPYANPGQPGQYGQPAQPGQYGQPAYPSQPQSVPPHLGADQTSGQPAYSAFPQSSPPNVPPGQPGYLGQPAYQPGGQPPAKSNKGLIIGLIGGGVALLLILCTVGVVLFLNSADDPEDPTTIGTNAPTAGPKPSGGNKPGNNGITADSSSDFGDVCQKGTILNAADYKGPAGAKAYVFSNSPTGETRWSSKSLNSTASYYAKSADFAQVSVVGCLAYEAGSEAPGQKCQIKASDGTQLTVDYISSRYKLTFYAAKTGEKIGDGGTINAPANKCPSVLTYNKETLKSYASPDSGSIDAAVKTLLG